MKIRFIYPRFKKLIESRHELADLKEHRSVGNFRMPPALGIPILSALTPSDWEVGIFDENIEDIDYNDDADLIAVSFFTPQAENGFKIASRFKEKGKTVICGGMHPSMCAEETLKYCDSVCIGEAEEIWITILDDFKKGKLKRIYKPAFPDMKNVPVPDRKIFCRDRDKKPYDWEAAMVQVMRGCAFACSQCILPIIGGKSYRFKPVENVIRDIDSLDMPEFFLTDDSIILPDENCHKYAQKLFYSFALKDLRIFLSGTLNMKTTDEYLNLLVKGGVVSVYLVTGFDPLSMMAFQTRGKKYFDWSLEVIKKLKDFGIHVFGSFGLGFDFQDEAVFDLTMEFIEKSNIDTAEFFILTPFPNTPAYKLFKEQNRILHYNWSDYNTAEVVFKPKNFTEDRLREGFIQCWRNFYSKRPVDDSLSIFTEPKK